VLHIYIYIYIYDISRLRVNYDEAWYVLKGNTQNAFNVHGPVRRNNYSNIQYIERDATLHSLFYLETALHVSCGTSTHPQERKQLCLQHLVLVTP